MNQKFSIKLHYSFIIFIILGLLTGFINKIFILFILLLLHEFGHVFLCRIYNRKIKKITFFLFGGIIEYDELDNVSLLEDFFIYIAGILVNLVIMFMLPKNSLIYDLNLQIILFNILPIYPLDGGRLLELFLSRLFKFKDVIPILSFFSLFFSIILIILNIFIIKSPNFFIVLLYLIFENYILFKKKRKKYIRFLLKKYLFPNKKLKEKKIKSFNNGLINNFYKGVNNVLLNESKKIEEKQILENYFVGKS